jgi:hypothetical protein
MAYFQIKNPDLGKFLGPCNGRCWYIIGPVGLFYGYLVYFMANWSIGIFCGDLVYFVVI